MKFGQIDAKVSHFSGAEFMRKPRLTARKTKRLTKEERSAAMKRAWAKRRKTGTAPAKKRKKPGPLSAKNKRISRSLKATWRRGWRDGTKPKHQKPQRVHLTPEERSEIAKKAAAGRSRRAKQQLARDRKLLNLSRTASAKDVRNAFDAARRQLNLHQDAPIAHVREAIEADRRPASKRRQTVFLF